LDEFGYVIAKRDRLYGTNSIARIDPGVPADAFRAGRSIDSIP
jgi:hypothetical protein